MLQLRSLGLREQRKQLLKHAAGALKLLHGIRDGHGMLAAGHHHLGAIRRQSLCQLLLQQAAHLRTGVRHRLALSKEQAGLLLGCHHLADTGHIAGIGLQNSQHELLAGYSK